MKIDIQSIITQTVPTTKGVKTRIAGMMLVMPRSNKDVTPALPSTLERSPKKARDTYEAALANAEKTYGGDEAAAHRVAWGAVKHGFEKRGDHWEAKEGPGPSDERSKSGGPDASGASYGGVDVEGHTKAELLDEAREAGVDASSAMTKAELGTELMRANRRADRKAREPKSG